MLSTHSYEIELLKNKLLLMNIFRIKEKEFFNENVCYRLVATKVE